MANGDECTKDGPRRWSCSKQVGGCETYLRPGMTLAELDRIAAQQSDTEAALGMQKAKPQLFRHLGKLSA